MKLLPKILWFLLAFFAFANGVEALRYLLPHVPFPAEIDNFYHRRLGLTLHVVGGSIALLAGPLQFVPRFRASNWNRHRVLGWVYASAVLLGASAAFYIAPHSDTGWVAASGFFTLAVFWLATTALAVRFIVRGDAIRHRRWMIRSYALTAAAITLRIYLPLSLFAFHVHFSTAYHVIAWLCWIPNAIAAEIYLHFVPIPSRAALPATLARAS